MASEYILEMNNITKEFPGVKALDNVNLKVKQGEIHALCGENGAGKSTLMNLLSGNYPFGSYSGDIIYKGELCKFHDIKAGERKGIVIIHQELALSPYLSVAENIFMGNEQLSCPGVIDWDKTRVNAKKMLEKVGLGNENINAPVNTLGVGKQQLIEIAKALSKNVELLILDEPTASLNDEESAHLLDILRGLKKQGITSIMISHKLNEINAIADSITIIRDGKTIETLNKETDDCSEDRIIKGMVGREMSNRYPPRDNLSTGEVILEVKNWNVWHPEDETRQMIKDVNFKVHAGEVVGFAGLMGAGRTELAMSIFGKSYGQGITGEIYMHGKKVTINNVKDAVNAGIAYTSEDRKNYGLNLIADVKTNMTMAALRNYYANKGVVDSNKEILDSEDFRKKINVKTPSVNQVV